jgi:SAM-dependent methyltransferase
MRDTNELLNEALDAAQQPPPYGPRRKSRAISGGRIAAFVVALLLLPLAGVSAPGKDVRYEPSPFPVVRAMLELANVGPNDVVYDLGSGDGRIVIMAAKEFGARGVGIDIDPELIAEARANARKAGVENKVQFIEGNMFGAALGSATVVTLFLHPDPNLRLRPKLLAELKPGSRIVSYIWDLGDWKPDAERTAENDKIYLWRVPEPAGRSGMRYKD